MNKRFFSTARLPQTVTQLSTISLPRRTAALLCALAGCCIAAHTESNEILARGNPPLTREMASAFTTFTGWVLELQFTAEQENAMTTVLVKDWDSGDRAHIDSHLEWIQLSAEALKTPPAERAALREELRTKFLTELKNHRRSPDSKWLLEQYRRAHDPLAPGNPALTRQISDAGAEALAFMCSEVIQQQVSPDTVLKDAMAEHLTRRWPMLTDDEQKVLAAVPYEWAVLRRKWPTLTRIGRAQYRREWRHRLGPRTIDKFGAYSALQSSNKRLDAIFDSVGQRPLSGEKWREVASELDSLVLLLRKKYPSVAQRWVHTVEEAARVCRENAHAGMSPRESSAPIQPSASAPSTPGGLVDPGPDAMRAQLMSNILNLQHSAGMAIALNMGPGWRLR